MPEGSPWPLHGCAEQLRGPGLGSKVFALDQFLQPRRRRDAELRAPADGRLAVAEAIRVAAERLVPEVEVGELGDGGVVE